MWVPPGRGLWWTHRGLWMMMERKQHLRSRIDVLEQRLAETQWQLNEVMNERNEAMVKLGDALGYGDDGEATGDHTVVTLACEMARNYHVSNSDIRFLRQALNEKHRIIARVDDILNGDETNPPRKGAER